MMTNKDQQPIYYHFCGPRKNGIINVSDAPTEPIKYRKAKKS